MPKELPPPGPLTEAQLESLAETVADVVERIQEAVGGELDEIAINALSFTLAWAVCLPATTAEQAEGIFAEHIAPSIQRTIMRSFDGFKSDQEADAEDMLRRAAPAGRA